ncbi:hypothetical protein ADEAN_000676100 [Angomonas deanei]|uniref:Uncharacterized protein n=1 Tax=Angomonas deanei TaxID=59799 RepID=A0A7G2CIL3_9TRYP|nr:hypothetical protein ADEAN_000676100 [Angomonas deanei]
MKNGVQSHHLYTIFSMAALELYGTIPVDDTWLTEAHTPTPSPSSEDSDSEVSSLSPSEIDAPIRVSTWLVGATLPRLYHAAHSFLRLERQEEKERREAAEREATPATADTAASGEEGDTDHTANDDETPPAE